MIERWKNSGRGGDGGFTLIELLVVIVILGVLAAVVVFAVGGVTDRGEESACDADERTVRTAQEAYYAQEEEYAADTAALAGAGFLSAESEMHSTDTSGDVTPIAGGDCA